MTLTAIVSIVAQALTLAIIVRALLSWFPDVRALAPVTGLLDRATDPVVGPIRRRLPAFGGIDLSPLIAVLLIGVVESLVLGVLAGH